MSIRDWGIKIKGCAVMAKNRLPQGESASYYYTGVIIALVGLSSFGLGRLSLLEDKHTPIIIENVTGNVIQSTLTTTDTSTKQTTSATQSIVSGGKLVASKSGTKYYFPWCASNIAEKNKIWFNSEAEAKAKGYEPAAKCKGLK
ncbi:MAG: hypothetical protein EXS59_00280 [Candidatus Taylorbacteria bacterium]|nr:hypothetical protein [Candidatus Taylorbacteria bacterium]